MFHIGEPRRTFVDSLKDNEEINNKQQAVLERFFHLLGHLSFDKAKEFLEREKDAAIKSHTITQFFSTVLSTFIQLCTAEKNYAHLNYLAPKGFLRKDLKSMYEAVQNEFLRFEGRCCSTPVNTPAVSPVFLSRTPSPHDYYVPPTPSPSEMSDSGSFISLGSLVGASSSNPPHDVLENLACHLSGQLHHYVSARVQLMDFYEKMNSMGSHKFVNLDTLIEAISSIIKENQKLFHHPLLIPLKSSFSYECELLLKLLECQSNMQKWKFLESLLCLQDAHSKLGEWTTALKDAKKSLQGSSRQVPLPTVYLWLGIFKAALVSKFTLYFHKILSLQTVSQEMKNLCSKVSEDYFQKIVSFQKRYDAACIAFVLDANEAGDYKGHGYTYPGKLLEAPKGLNSYPAFVCVPPEKPISHWPNLIMIMGNEEFKKSDAVHTFYDKRVNSTYFLIKVELYITMVTIFDGHKSEKDTHIMKFINSLCTQLRCNKLFAMLKP